MCVEHGRGLDGRKHICIYGGQGFGLLQRVHLSCSFPPLPQVGLWRWRSSLSRVEPFYYRLRESNPLPLAAYRTGAGLVPASLAVCMDEWMDG